MKLKSTIDLFAVAGGDSYLNHPPGLITDTPKVRDIARKRLVKTNPDVDAGGPGSGRRSTGLSKKEREKTYRKSDKAYMQQTGRLPAGGWSERSLRIRQEYLRKNKNNVDAAKYQEDSQKDNAGFIGKPFRVQDTKYGHYISEHDNEDDANKASLARPYSRVLKHVEPQQTEKSRQLSRKKVSTLQCFISKEGGKHCVRSHQTHKNFGCYPTREAAAKRLAQIKRFK